MSASSSSPKDDHRSQWLLIAGGPTIPKVNRRRSKAAIAMATGHSTTRVCRRACSCDMGTGDGFVAFRATACIGWTLRVPMTDIAERMLRHAKQRPKPVRRGALEAGAPLRVVVSGRCYQTGWRAGAQLTTVGRAQRFRARQCFTAQERSIAAFASAAGRDPECRRATSVRCSSTSPAQVYAMPEAEPDHEDSHGDH